MREPIRRPPLREIPDLPTPTDPRDRQEGRVFRWSLAGALVTHLVLLALPLPTSQVDAAVEPPPRPVFRIVNRRPKPPTPPTPVDRHEPPRGPVVLVPVPDVHDPEPLADEDPLPAPDPVALDVDADLYTDILDGPPPPPPPTEEGPVYVIGGIEPPEALDAPRPRYPEAARQVGRDGLVVLQAVIDREGRVQEVQVLRGAPFGMTEAAVVAVRSWRFRPATRDGEPVSVYYQLTVRFHRGR